MRRFLYVRSFSQNVPGSCKTPLPVPRPRNPGFRPLPARHSLDPSHAKYSNHTRRAEPARPSPSVSLALFLSLNRLLRHLNQAVLGLAVRKVGNRGNGPVRVVVREGTRLLDAVALEHQLTRLHGPVSHTRLAPTESKWPRNHTFSTSPSRSNLRPTSAPSSGFCFHANSRGAVASPSSRSAPAGLPRSLPLRV